MSGIVGLFYRHNHPVRQEQLSKMVNIIAHRGLDDVGTWRDRNIGLGNCLLYTTPESLAEKLPFVDQTGNFIITADARIDNRQELIPQLDFKGISTGEITDSQVILAAYLKWGQKCLEQLIGDFAFAIWDKRQEYLFCARDHLGVKPFYYYCSNDIFVFASEIKAILTLPEVSCRVNEIAIANYIAGIEFDGRLEDSFYHDICELYGTEKAVVSSDKIQVQSYWQPNLNHELKLSSAEEYLEAFQELFQEAVRCRLRSAFPVGSTLSGGLDSSSISCVANRLMQQELNGSLQTFSAIFPTLAENYPKTNERPYIDLVNTQLEIEGNFICADRIRPFVDLDRLLWHGEEPSSAPNLYMSWSIYKEAQKQGTRILLTGSDGDTTVTYGYQYLSELAATFKWSKLLETSNIYANISGKSVKNILWRSAFAPIMPRFANQAIGLLRGKPLPKQMFNLTIDTIINPSFAERIGITNKLVPQAAKPSWGSKYKTFVRRNHWQELHSGSVKYTMQWLDKIAGAFSVEARHPFCDKRLVEFCLALPSEQKFYGGWSRSIFRRAMQDVIPPEIQWRKSKGDLSPNVKIRLLQDEKSLLERVIFDECHEIADYININKLQSKYHHYVAEPMQSDAEVMDIYVALNLYLWLKRAKY